MESHSKKFKVRLGLFVAGGIALFVITIFIIGKQKNLFNPVFKLTTAFFNVSGLQVGNNVRFSGITVGTVDNITIINDSAVRVDLLVRKEIQKFIKSDGKISIGSEGIIGDRLVIISQGTNEARMARDGDVLSSVEPVETDAIIKSLAVTSVNAEIISKQLAEIMVKVNGGEGTLGKLIADTTIAENIDKTILNLRKSSKGLNENMEAAKDNFLLKGFFNKKARAAERAKRDSLDKNNNKIN
jgi:phospholipid/cholesterol/gamma-HCH transport system substrate-binding protein